MFQRAFQLIITFLLLNWLSTILTLTLCTFKLLISHIIQRYLKASYFCVIWFLACTNFTKIPNSVIYPPYHINFIQFSPFYFIKFYQISDYLWYYSVLSFPKLTGLNKEVNKSQ